MLKKNLARFVFDFISLKLKNLNCTGLVKTKPIRTEKPNQIETKRIKE